MLWRVVVFGFWGCGRGGERRRWLARGLSGDVLAASGPLVLLGEVVLDGPAGRCRRLGGSGWSAGEESRRARAESLGILRPSL